MKQVYYALFATLLFCLIISGSSAYFGAKHSSLHNPVDLNNADAQLETMNNIEDIKNLALVAHQERIYALESKTNLYKQYATFFAIVSALCFIALYTLYKANISNTSLDTDAKKRSPLS